MNRLNIKSAVKSHSKFDLSCTHLTTMNFGQIQPIYNLELVPGDKITVDTSVFSRLAPLYVPTYGKASLKTAAFFVPYHQIAEDAEAYFAGKTSWQGQTPVLRHTTIRELFYVFYSVSTAGSATNYDWKYTESDGTTTVYRKLTSTGKYYYKILRGLGYQIPEGANLKTGSDWMTTTSKIKVNVYPLLCFLKAYNDYMSQTQRFNSSILSTCLLNIRQNKAYTIPGTSASYSATGALSSAFITQMLGQVLLCYDSDMFISAWQSPNAPLLSIESVDTVPFPMTSSESLSVNQNKDYTGYGLGQSTVLSQRALEFLRSFDNWVRRNNYSGSRDVQQIFSRFGIKADDYKTHFSHMLGEKSTPIQIGDVTSVAQTDGATLGDYAGKGIINGGDKIHVEASDYGQLIILCWVAVKPMYADGYDYSVLKNAPLDFYNPEFDGVGPRAISMIEVANCPKEDFTDGNAVFGFTERYNEYRNAKDKITGDFCLSKDMNAWHFGRDLSELRDSQTLVAQNPSFCQQLPISSEFDRIFNVPETEQYFDKFYLTINFDVEAYRPMLNSSEVADLGNGNLNIEKNGDTLS